MPQPLPLSSPGDGSADQTRKIGINDIAIAVFSVKKQVHDWNTILFLYGLKYSGGNIAGHATERRTVDHQIRTGSDKFNRPAQSNDGLPLEIHGGCQLPIRIQAVHLDSGANHSGQSHIVRTEIGLTGLECGVTFTDTGGNEDPIHLLPGQQLNRMPMGQFNRQTVARPLT